MPFFEGYELIQYALGAEIEDRLFMRWVNGYQFTMEYEEFKKEAIVVKVEDNRSANEILRSVKDIIG